MTLNFSAYQNIILQLHLAKNFSLRQAHQCLIEPEAPAARKRLQRLHNTSNHAAVTQLMHWLDKPATHCVTFGHETYPALLRTLSDPPLVLYGRGSWTVFDKPAVAIVGARRCSPQAAAYTFKLARDIASQGWCVVSGLARGIDTAAHEGALASGVSGSTIAVLGTGIDRVYPPESSALAHQMVESGGLLLSEFPLGSAPLPAHFPQRNRIVAALGRATIVAQAALRSGSMITARLAAEMGREVLAVPGKPGDPLSEGPHELIRQGAGLMEQVDDLWRTFALCAQMGIGNSSH